MDVKEVLQERVQRKIESLWRDYRKYLMVGFTMPDYYNERAGITLTLGVNGVRIVASGRKKEVGELTPDELVWVFFGLEALDKKCQGRAGKIRQALGEGGEALL